MSYNINRMPETVEEFELLIQSRLDEEAGKSATNPHYQPLSRLELEAEYACYKPRNEQACVEAQLTPAQELARQKEKIDYATSQAIMAGFDYEVEGRRLHFNYDSFDQQNFADTANACLLAKSGIEGLPQSVTWNAYDQAGNLVRLTLAADEFLALYTQGALAHKAACMEEGGMKKAALRV